MKNLEWNRNEFARELCGWFATAQRDLPWRRTPNNHDAYRVLVSEIMLQQTTVAAVIPFYERFLNRFPSLPDLAAAEVDEVLCFWAGLGYYSRARNLHQLARELMKNHGGEFPRDLQTALQLPGVGRYTAGAVTSLAFDVPSPIVDANVARVLSRVLMVEGNLKAGPQQKILWDEAEKLVSAGGCPPSQFNAALMELGALICVPNTPRCGECPVSQFCAARAAGRQNELPHIAPKSAPIELYDACARIEHNGRVLLRQREDKPGVWWRGMWELPRFRVGKSQNPAEVLLRGLSEEHSVAVKDFQLWRTVKHTVTKHRITLDCFQVEVVDEPHGAQWFTREEWDKLALPAAMKRLLSKD